jgi:hypothetical protein
MKKFLLLIYGFCITMFFGVTPESFDQRRDRYHEAIKTVVNEAKEDIKRDVKESLEVIKQALRKEGYLVNSTQEQALNEFLREYGQVSYEAFFSKSGIFGQAIRFLIQSKDAAKIFASAESLKEAIHKLSETDLEYEEFSDRMIQKMTNDLNAIQNRMRDYLIGESRKSVLMEWVPPLVALFAGGSFILYGGRFYNYITSLLGKIPSLWSKPVVPARSFEETEVPVTPSTSASPPPRSSPPPSAAQVGDTGLAEFGEGFESIFGGDDSLPFPLRAAVNVTPWEREVTTENLIDKSVIELSLIANKEIAQLKARLADNLSLNDLLEIIDELNGKIKSYEKQEKENLGSGVESVLRPYIKEFEELRLDTLDKLLLHQDLYTSRTGNRLVDSVINAVMTEKDIGKAIEVLNGISSIDDVREVIKESHNRLRIYEWLMKALMRFQVNAKIEVHRLEQKLKDGVIKALEDLSNQAAGRFVELSQEPIRESLFIPAVAQAGVVKEGRAIASEGLIRQVAMKEHQAELGFRPPTVKELREGAARRDAVINQEIEVLRARLQDARGEQDLTEVIEELDKKIKQYEQQERESGLDVELKKLLFSSYIDQFRKLRKEADELKELRKESRKVMEDGKSALNRFEYALRDLEGRIANLNPDEEDVDNYIRNFKEFLSVRDDVFNECVKRISNLKGLLEREQQMRSDVAEALKEVLERFKQLLVSLITQTRRLPVKHWIKYFSLSFERALALDDNFLMEGALKNLVLKITNLFEFYMILSEWKQEDATIVGILDNAGYVLKLLSLANKLKIDLEDGLQDLMGSFDYQNFLKWLEDSEYVIGTLLSQRVLSSTRVPEKNIVLRGIASIGELQRRALLNDVGLFVADNNLDPEYLSKVQEIVHNIIEVQETVHNSLPRVQTEIEDSEVEKLKEFEKSLTSALIVAYSRKFKMENPIDKGEGDGSSSLPTLVSAEGAEAINDQEVRNQEIALLSRDFSSLLPSIEGGISSVPEAVLPEEIETEVTEAAPVASPIVESDRSSDDVSSVISGSSSDFESAESNEYHSVVKQDEGTILLANENFVEGEESGNEDEAVISLENRSVELEDFTNQVSNMSDNVRVDELMNLSIRLANALTEWESEESGWSGEEKDKLNKLIGKLRKLKRVVDLHILKNQLNNMIKVADNVDVAELEGGLVRLQSTLKEWEDR